MPNHRRSAACAATAIILGFAGAAAQASPTCPVDWNNDGVVNSTDVSDFINDWFTDQANGTLVTDFDGNGIANSTDVSTFINAWFNGCASQVELAANPLALFPHAEFVRAFNTAATVSIAIDPNRYPAIAGVSANVYITADRTPTQWALDSTLVDVRGGGATPINFGSTDIQSCTFALPGSAALPADAGEDIGVPYDMVIDMNGNGLLDDGDIADALDPAEAGFYVVKNLSTAGPLAVTTINYTVTGVTPGFTSERTYYPTAIAGMGRLPLVVISHGNGHQHTWYDFLGTHLASHGYIVMAHMNNTVPGIETCSLTTLQHTDAILGQQATISGGVLNNHIDADNIIWIGHSRGGEGVARAYDRLIDAFNPVNYDFPDIKLISSIAPTDFLGFNNSDPQDANYHLLYGAADGDVCGCPDSPIAQSFILYDRSTGRRSATYIHGADHNDFNCCGFEDFNGPLPALGRPNVQIIQKQEYLALIKYVIEGNIAGRDYMWRQWETFRPAGAPAQAVVLVEYKDADSFPDMRIIDDYQTNPATNLNSAGGAVTTDVLAISEAQMRDTDASFATGPAFNGFTRANTGDLTKGTVFGWTVGTPRFYTQSIPAALQDVSGYDVLSFRAGQQTRHADTIAPPLGQLNFTVTLIDANGDSSTISSGWDGGAFEELYQRTGFGAGTGWQVGFETVRIPLEAFTTNGRVLDLTRITDIRFDFGPASGNDRGRIGLDDIHFTTK